MTCGIYCIDGPGNKRYVGQSLNIERRVYVHFQDLIRGRHCCRELQAAFDIYGTERFHWKILDQCAIGQLDEREYYQMAIWPGKLYNKAPAKLRKAAKKRVVQAVQIVKMVRRKKRGKPKR